MLPEPGKGIVFSITMSLWSRISYAVRAGLLLHFSLGYVQGARYGSNHGT